ncbi:MAG: phosphomannomutase/phosphoglucomutase [Firmicutes bacterium]|jgi:phosphomannomutase/phosphoglucomutase|nr:phosphomannomutase/phosphoglucomutase [Bacillota bacterium]
MPVINPRVFREYDIRGLVDVDLDPESVGLIGKAYGTYLRRRGLTDVVVGRDNRPSSELYRNAIVRGLLETGCNVADIGLVVTPIFYFARVRYGIEGGVMITGSHNPPEYNGFKLGAGPATMYGEQIQEIRRIAESGRFEKGRGSVREVDPAEEYVATIVKSVGLGPRPVTVVVDCGNGSGGLFGPRILELLGCRVIPLFCEPDGNFPNHFPDPVKPENLRLLSEAVRDHRADVGVAYDGDADRLGAVDEMGRPVFGDVLMALFWREILPRHPGAAALVEVKCSQALVDEIRRLGGRPMFWRTGHSLIKAKMREIGAVFTGEMSGHMFFADEYYGYDDAIYASARLMRILSNSGSRLSEMVADLPTYYSTPETRVECPDDAKFAIVDEITRYFKSRYDVVDIDGVRVMFPEGWGLVRASNTQPALVLRAEASDAESLEVIKRRIREKLSEYPAVGEVAW